MGSQQEVRTIVENATGAIELPLGGSSIFTNIGTGAMSIASNAYTVDNAWYRKLAGYASMIELVSGTIVMKVAATAAKDSAITWTTVGTVTAAGEFKLSADWGVVQSGVNLVWQYQGAATTNVISPDEA